MNTHAEARMFQGPCVDIQGALCLTMYTVLLNDWFLLSTSIRPPSIPTASSLVRRPISKLANKENKHTATADSKKTVSAVDDKLNSAPLEEAK